MTPYYQDELVTIYNADCRDVLPSIDPDTVDFVLTDPPYPLAFQHLYEEMGRQAFPLLREGSSLVSLCGHYQVPAVLDALATAGLRYWWLAGMGHDTLARMPGKWVTIRWKPAVWFVKGRRRPGDSNSPMDMLHGARREKEMHEWGQPVNWFAHWIEQLCPPGGLVLDPFMGAGPVAQACHELGRRYIGIELVEEYCAVAVSRLSQQTLNLGGAA